jgi:Mitochondrial glycoprotein
LQLDPSNPFKFLEAIYLDQLGRPSANPRILHSQLLRNGEIPRENVSPLLYHADALAKTKSADQILSEKFNHERQLELEASDPSKPPAGVDDFIQNSSWSIVDKPGTHDVELVREFGNEK